MPADTFRLYTAAMDSSSVHNLSAYDGSSASDIDNEIRALGAPKAIRPYRSDEVTGGDYKDTLSFILQQWLMWRAVVELPVDEEAPFPERPSAEMIRSFLL